MILALSKKLLKENSFCQIEVEVFFFRVARAETNRRQKGWAAAAFTFVQKKTVKREGKGAGVTKAKGTEELQKKAEKAHVTRGNRQLSALAPPSTFVSSSHHQLMIASSRQLNSQPKTKTREATEYPLSLAPVPFNSSSSSLRSSLAFFFFFFLLLMSPPIHLYLLF